MHTRKIAALATVALLFVGTASCGSDSDDSSSGDQTTTTIDDSSSGDQTTTSVDGSSSADAPSTNGRPSAEEIASGIVKGLNESQERADCAAEKVESSDLPAASVQAIANSDPDSISATEMDSVKEVLDGALADCP